MVRYQIQYKPINPATNNCVTNTTLNAWTGNTVSATGQTNPNYDMLLMFIKTSTNSATLNASDFKRVESETWAVYAVKDSIKEAKIAAKPLIKKYGVDNVQICKIIQAGIEIVFGDEE